MENKSGIIFAILCTLSVLWLGFIAYVLISENALFSNFTYKHVYLIASNFFFIFLVWVASSSLKPFTKKPRL